MVEQVGYCGRGVQRQYAGGNGGDDDKKQWVGVVGMGRANIGKERQEGVVCG